MSLETSQDKMPEISVIIPCYSRVKWLPTCLLALSRQDIGRTFQVVVIDDGSPNETEIRELVQDARIGGYNLIFERQDNAGPAAARNHGVRLSSGNILCFLDDDSVPAPDWLGNMVSPFLKNIDVALVSGSIKSFYKDGLSAELEEAVYYGMHWATCNIAYRRDIFLQLGGFDESFPDASWEDNDLGFRARWGGYRHVMAEEAVVSHPHEQTWDEFRIKCFANGRGAARFCTKWMNKRPLWAFATPVLMSRRLLYGLHPSCWFGDQHSLAKIRFYWSWYSLKGFLGVVLETNQTR